MVCQGNRIQFVFMLRLRTIDEMKKNTTKTMQPQNTAKPFICCCKFKFIQTSRAVDVWIIQMRSTVRAANDRQKKVTNINIEKRVCLCVNLSAIHTMNCALGAAMLVLIKHVYTTILITGAKIQTFRLLRATRPLKLCSTATRDSIASAASVPQYANTTDPLKPFSVQIRIFLLRFTEYICRIKRNSVAWETKLSYWNGKKGDKIEFLFVLVCVAFSACTKHLH